MYLVEKTTMPKKLALYYNQFKFNWTFANFLLKFSSGVTKVLVLHATKLEPIRWERRKGWENAI